MDWRSLRSLVVSCARAGACVQFGEEGSEKNMVKKVIRKSIDRLKDTITSIQGESIH